MSFFDMLPISLHVPCKFKAMRDTRSEYYFVIFE